MPTVRTLTTYLEMTEPIGERLTPPMAETAVEEVARPASAEYYEWYRGVGGQFHWIDRLLIPQNELEDIIHDPLVGVYVLSIAGDTAGFCELDRRIKEDVEVAYFGLMPDFIGRGLGKYFLNWTVHQAWSFEPRRVWLHTCDLDHEAALPNYRKAGFRVYDEQVIEQVIKDGFPGGRS